MVKAVASTTRVSTTYIDTYNITAYKPTPVMHTVPDDWYQDSLFFSSFYPSLHVLVIVVFKNQVLACLGDLFVVSFRLGL